MGSKLQTNGSVIDTGKLLHLTEDKNAAAVYFTKEISPEALIKIYEALGKPLCGKVALKISTGESAKSNHLRPELIGDLAKKLDATIIECMTAYGGSRSEIDDHKHVAEERGYTKIAKFDLMDEEGEKVIPYSGKRINHAIVGSHIDSYDNILVLSHFKGHAMAGLGGAIKNVGIGMSSKSGKVYVHTAGTRTSGDIWFDEQDAWLEALAETVKAVSDYEGNGEKMLYISVMNRLSVDCDCDGNPAEPDMHDIGILASTDPVALDQACVDLVYAVPDGHKLIERMEDRHGIHVIEHAAEIGLGVREYRLLIID